jgi:hypothetical protein
MNDVYDVEKRDVIANESVDAFLTRMSKGLEHYSSILKENVESMRRYADGSRQQVIYKPGDKVLFHVSKYQAATPRHAQSHSKILPKWIGPFTVVRMLSENVVELEERVESLTSKHVNVSYLKPFREEVSLIYNVKSDVPLDPEVFEFVCEQLNFYPEIDVFASAKHHQLSAYCSRTYDVNAVCQDGFTLDWSRHKCYLNPPWEEISNVLDKVVTDKAVALLVIPYWRRAEWFGLWENLNVRSIIIDEGIYLDREGYRRPPPKWRTCFSIVDGRRMY